MQLFEKRSVMRYKITNLVKGRDFTVEEFNDLNEAQIYLKKQLAADQSLNVENTYRILDFDEVIQQYNTKDLPAIKDKENFASEANTSTSQRSSSAPTPFNTAPRPAGMPQSWVRDE